jgi:hypothetical protein
MVSQLKATEYQALLLETFDISARAETLSGE